MLRMPILFTYTSDRSVFINHVRPATSLPAVIYIYHLRSYEIETNRNKSSRTEECAKSQCERTARFSWKRIWMMMMTELRVAAVVLDDSKFGRCWRRILHTKMNYFKIRSKEKRPNIQTRQKRTRSQWIFVCN